MENDFYEFFSGVFFFNKKKGESSQITLFKYMYAQQNVIR